MTSDRSARLLPVFIAFFKASRQGTGLFDAYRR